LVRKAEISAVRELLCVKRARDGDGRPCGQQPWRGSGQSSAAGRSRNHVVPPWRLKRCIAYDESAANANFAGVPQKEVSAIETGISDTILNRWVLSRRLLCRRRRWRDACLARANRDRIMLSLLFPSPRPLGRLP
jgi:hypothetical protein